MKTKLLFDETRYEVKSCELDGRRVTYRAFEDIVYCENPKDAIQRMHIFVPEAYYRGETVNGYTLHTAPVFMPNTVGGYMPGAPDSPGKDHSGRINSVFEALTRGYVTVCAGVRGRTTGRKSEEFFEGGRAEDTGTDTGRFVGKAPALLIDMKAAVRYLRFNQDRVPGDTDKIITNGTSAGGALSAMMGATGNHPDFAPYLSDIGAADAPDDIFCASCYCPIHNLEHADMAYEWMFAEEHTFHMARMEKTPDGVHFIPVDGTLSDEQIALSKELKAAFPSYVNGLHLIDADGKALTLNEDGTGSFRDHIEKELLISAQKELETHDSATRLHALAVRGSEAESLSCLQITDGCVSSVDWNGFVRTITRMKPVPAFDALDLHSPECEEFGTEEIPARHFTAFAKEHSAVNGALAPEEIVRLINPVSYIGKSSLAPHWRIRHGSFDRDTALAIPVILSLLVRMQGADVDFLLPWGLPHSGDYDLPELFDWIDSCCR